ncbi:hypothetical protein [Butyrivibrio sp. VCD2006]|uniref:hypothetical protein n=1 Tax=Butyrivibrio sp. VCD2006 TaxID=1280664 RepID=UPI00041363A8|nr:hypothetical protein [Butyrivibrio sp. VCD2006]
MITFIMNNWLLFLAAGTIILPVFTLTGVRLNMPMYRKIQYYGIIFAIWVIVSGIGLTGAILIAVRFGMRKPLLISVLVIAVTLFVIIWILSYARRKSGHENKSILKKGMESGCFQELMMMCSEKKVDRESDAFKKLKLTEKEIAYIEAHGPRVVEAFMDLQRMAMHMSEEDIAHIRERKNKKK